MKQVSLYVLLVVERNILHTVYVDNNNLFVNGAMLSLH